MSELPESRIEAEALVNINFIVYTLTQAGERSLADRVFKLIDNGLSARNISHILTLVNGLMYIEDETFVLNVKLNKEIFRRIGAELSSIEAFLEQ